MSNLILMYYSNPTSECLTKPFDLLRKKEFVDNNGVTFIGKNTYVAGILGISFLSAIMLADFMLQHTRKPKHDKSCRVDIFTIRAKLSPIASQNRLKMLTSELLRNAYLDKKGDTFFLDHKYIEKISSVKFLDEVMKYFSNE